MFAPTTLLALALVWQSAPGALQSVYTSLSSRDCKTVSTHEEGGHIVLLAECYEGLGRTDFLKWFDSPDSRAVEARHREGYEVNGQTAWSLLTKAERFRVQLVSALPEDEVRRMRMTPARTLEEALARIESGDGYVLPRGAAFMPVVV